MSKRSRARRAKANAKAKKAAEAQKHQAQTKTEEDQAKIAQYLADKRAAQDAAQATQAAAAQKQAEAAAAAETEARTTAAQKQAAQTAAAAAEATQTEQWITTKETLALAQISRTTLHLKTKAGTFPPAIKIGKKCVWIRSEIDQWMKGVTYT